MVLGLLLFVSFYFSPLADVAATAIASGHGRAVSQRDLFYGGVDWMRDPEGYAKATAGEPASRRSLVVMGSSELFSSVSENPRDFLPAHVSDFDLFLSGRGYTQSLYHAIELAAMGGDIQSRKVALIVSPQWFQPGGELPKAFQSVFSDSAWQAMLHNSRLTPQTKAALVARVSTLLNGTPGFEEAGSHGALAAATRFALMPYLQVVQRGQVLMEESKFAPSLAPYRIAKGSVSIDAIDWGQEKQIAGAQGAAAVHNQFNIADPYFATYIAANLRELKGSLVNVDYAAASPEYGDLELFLDVARELGISVMLISIPMNGAWEDYAGYTATRRADYYAKIRAMAARPGVQLADFSQHEYEPYFLYDTQHLGWIGWLDVIESCVAFQRS